MPRDDAGNSALPADQLAGERLFEDLDRWRSRHRPAQGADDLGAGRVAVRMQNPGAPVRRFAAKRQLPRAVPIEPGAKREQRSDPRRALLRENAHTLGDGETVRGSHRVPRMGRWRIARANGSRHTPLRQRA